MLGQIVPTEVYHLGPKQVSCTSSPRRHVFHTFFVPGNPGSLFYYLPWLQATHDILVAAANQAFGANQIDVFVHGFSHANHHFSQHGENTSPCIYGLEFQVEHAFSFVQTVLGSLMPSASKDARTTNSEKVMLSFIGHSIGAYIVLDMLDRFPPLVKLTLSCSLLMPFITWTTLPALHRWKLAALSLIPKITHLLARRMVAMLQNISLARRRALIASALKDEMDADCVEATATRLFTHRLIANFLCMGLDEIQTVPLNEHRMLAIITRLSAQLHIHALYTNDDLWAPETDMHRLRELGPYVATAFVPHVRHAFTMQRETYEPVNKALSLWFANALQGFALTCARGADRTNFSAIDEATSSVVQLKVKNTFQSKM